MVYTSNSYETEKSLYGTLQANVLLLKDLTRRLKYWVFELSPYYECVDKRYINGLKWTILWHMDNLKISRLVPNMVYNIIDMLDKKYGK